MTLNLIKKTASFMNAYSRIERAPLSLSLNIHTHSTRTHKIFATIWRPPNTLTESRINLHKWRARIRTHHTHTHAQIYLQKQLSTKLLKKKKIDILSLIHTDFSAHVFDTECSHAHIFFAIRIRILWERSIFCQIHARLKRF